MKVGFIGLGRMGGPMAANLAKAGFSVTGFDVLGTVVDGVAQASSASAAAEDADAVVTMLPNGDTLRDVCDRIVSTARKGALLVDCSTVDVDSARHAHRMASAHGLLSVDAPVSGGTGGATAGTLTFMAGGSDQAFDAAMLLFRVMGKRAIHCGDAGSGQVAKICNNMILGISMIAVSEAFGLADKSGLSRQKLFEVVSTSSGSCWSMNAYCPVPGVGPASPADNGYKPGFASNLMLKDLKLSQQAAEAAGAATPLGALATELFGEFVGAGYGDLDFSAMLPHLGSMARER
ncbi:3-hydroxyisobutyrate dehydrogenase [Mesorhizobium sp. 2RAF21]|uniref:3-hydroxyisobutyrate dehydrogenase n=1 Tax=Mesorhizobium sp. 2RAF21 TaxID=3232995 RepID=UPI003F97C61A